jgi:hypothetical protein
VTGFPYDDDWRWTGELVTVVESEPVEELAHAVQFGMIRIWFCLREDGYTFIPGWEELDDACAEAAWLMGFDPGRNAGYADGE